jgi:uncharacterized protein (DUF1015 family)
MTSFLVRPFAALRPAPEFAAEVAAPPYDVLNTEEARALADGKEWSFLHISKPEIDLAPGTDPFSDAVYAKASENMAKLIETGVLKRDDKPCFYVYRVQMGDHIQTGIAAAGSAEANKNNLIRRHELTRPDKENDRVRQIMAVRGHTGPVFTIHKPEADLTAVVDEVTAGAPAYSVTGEGDVQHTVWVVSDDALIDRISQGFERLGVIYIADGHHRSAAGTRAADECRDANPLHTGEEPYNSFLVVSFPEPEVKILDYNRIVKDLNGLTPEGLVEKLRASFDIEAADSAAKPAKPGQFGMYVAGQWYSLDFTGDVPADASASDRLDVSVLTAHALSPVLGVGDPRTDPRIDFVGGIRGMAELEKRVDSGDWAVAFALYPTSIPDLMSVADATEIMPPKTTWFEPKLADGLISLMLD